MFALLGARATTDVDVDMSTNNGLGAWMCMHINIGGMCGHKEWLTEVNVIGMVEHPNLVKLVGYCVENSERGMQRFLEYDCIPNGGLGYHLSTKPETHVSWTMRLKVAQDWIDKEGTTPLISASMNPQLYDVVKTLIELGANVNVDRPGCHARTPIHHAAKRDIE
ncbi:hypothetical protein L2E82_13867 [Cichorium intybus]|uniref:Uncharacterized protein n=1 Tax=Cichorium intybus TaxID=13427 RepID=A0ACB9EXU4_CICIN|nr:hypothetical protein L2E82_13867 [Cichorium intybus]